MARARDWDVTEMAEKIVALVTRASSVIEGLCEVQEIAEQAYLTKALMIRNPVVRFKEKHTRVSFAVMQFKIIVLACFFFF